MRAGQETQFWELDRRMEMRKPCSQAITATQRIEREQDYLSVGTEGTTHPKAPPLAKFQLECKVFEILSLIIDSRTADFHLFEFRYHHFIHFLSLM